MQKELILLCRNGQLLDLHGFASGKTFHYLFYLLNLDLLVPDDTTLILLPSDDVDTLENLALLKIVFWNISRNRLTHTSLTSMFGARRTSLSIAVVAEEEADCGIEAEEADETEGRWRAAAAAAPMHTTNLHSSPSTCSVICMSLV